MQGQDKSAQPELVFELTGGSLSLDFANTMSGNRAARPVEKLNTYADLVAWARQTGIASEERAQRLLLLASHQPDKAAAVLGRARELREAIYRIWAARIRRADPSPIDLGLLNRMLATALAHRRLSLVKHRLELGWAEDDSLDFILWPVVQSTAELLSSDDAGRVRLCEATLSQECDWLFLDLSRNRSRRWCSMRDCGNRAKARRHYHRKRKT